MLQQYSSYTSPSLFIHFKTIPTIPPTLHHHFSYSYYSSQSFSPHINIIPTTLHRHYSFLTNPNIPITLHHYSSHTSTSVLLPSFHHHTSQVLSQFLLHFTILFPTFHYSSSHNFPPYKLDTYNSPAPFLYIIIPTTLPTIPLTVQH